MNDMEDQFLGRPFPEWKEVFRLLSQNSADPELPLDILLRDILIRYHKINLEILELEAVKGAK